MARVVLAMSGGVDSSVAAHLLRADGHDVIGLFMRHGESEGAAAAACRAEVAPASEVAGAPAVHLPVLPVLGAVRPDHKQGCCSFSDAADARRVADRLDIPFYALNFEKEFGQIINYFVDEYSAGRTPNPCVMCNNWLKFGKLLEYADAAGAEFVATGHYARAVPAEAGATPALRCGLDPAKDQSYVLFGIARDVLPRVMFPVGGHAKTRIREIAAELGMSVADKKDSQEICFVPDGDYAALVRRKRGAADLGGEIVTVEGEVVGRHAGLEQFTIGQRKGLRLAFGEPRYVVRIEPETRRVVIGTAEQLGRREFTASRTNWLVDPPQSVLRCHVKVRYKSPPAAAKVTSLADGRMHVVLDEPKAGIAPGQAAVCYAGDRVLGGGWIE